jgi:hypothetical protein
VLKKLIIFVKNGALTLVIEYMSQDGIFVLRRPSNMFSLTIVMPLSFKRLPTLFQHRYGIIMRRLICLAN